MDALAGDKMTSNKELGKKPKEISKIQKARIFRKEKIGKSSIRLGGEVMAVIPKMPPWRLDTHWEDVEKGILAITVFPIVLILAAVLIQLDKAARVLTLPLAYVGRWVYSREWNL